MKTVQLGLAILVSQYFFFSSVPAIGIAPEPANNTTQRGFSIPIHGLPNVGNSCYMNASLQCLFQIPEFAQLVRKETATDIPFLEECKKLVNALDKKDDQKILMQTTELFNQISECLFDSSDKQQDALDLLTYIIDGIPELQPLFSLTLNTEIRCAECNAILRSANQTIYDLPLNAFQPQIITGINCQHCSNIQTQSHKKSKLINSPQYILINCDQLYEANEQTTLKNLHVIQAKLTDYNLVGIILYAGNKENGHYIAQIRENSTKKWHLCNDMHIIKFESTTTQKQKNHTSYKNQLVAFLPRILLYSKKQQNHATKVFIQK